MTQQSTSWVMKKYSARIKTATLSAKVNVSRPQSGITIDKVGENALKGQRILAFSHVPHAPPTLVDQYVRGDDLVASYLTPSKPSASRKDMQLTDQVYWRHIQPDDTGLWYGIELVISLQTDLLGIAPRVKLATTLRDGKVFLVKDAWHQPVLEPVKESVSVTGGHSTAVLVQSQESAWSYLQSLHYMDDASCEKTEIKFSAERVQIKSTLFVEHLEKGVIRRLRARGTFCESTDIKGLHLPEWFNEFASSEQPLTV